MSVKKWHMHCKLTIKWCDFFNICRYPVFLLVYKENSVLRELKTGMCWANTNLSEAKNAPGLALKKVLRTRVGVAKDIWKAKYEPVWWASYIVLHTAIIIYVNFILSILSLYLVLTEDSLSARAGWQWIHEWQKLYILLF